jgi:hypothetical protein
MYRAAQIQEEEEEEEEEKEEEDVFTGVNSSSARFC